MTIEKEDSEASAMKPQKVLYFSFLHGLMFGLKLWFKENYHWREQRSLKLQINIAVIANNTKDCSIFYLAKNN